MTVGVAGVPRPDEPDEPPEPPPGIVIIAETVEPVPMRFVAPTVTVTREPAVRPVRVQKVSVALTKVQERFTEYAVIAAPPSSTGAVHDATADVFDRDANVIPVGASGAVAGTPSAVAVFDDSAVSFTDVRATTFTS